MIQNRTIYKPPFQSLQHNWMFKTFWLSLFCSSIQIFLRIDSMKLKPDDESWKEPKNWGKRQKLGISKQNRTVFNTVLKLFFGRFGHFYTIWSNLILFWNTFRQYLCIFRQFEPILDLVGTLWRNYLTIVVTFLDILDNFGPFLT